MNKGEVLILTYPAAQHVISTLEDCAAEFEELMIEKEWFVTEVVDRIETALEVLATAETTSE